MRDDRVAVPDYELDDIVRATTSNQLKALADPIRRSILDLVLERSATTTELAAALGRPRGTVDHHLKVLATNGLVKVVGSRRVRAMEERYWGRTARTIEHGSPAAPVEDGSLNGAGGFIADALAEVRRTVDRDDVPRTTTLRHARIADVDAAEFVRRLDELAVEFASHRRGGSTVYGLLLAIYPSDQPVLPPKDDDR